MIIPFVDLSVFVFAGQFDTDLHILKIRLIAPKIDGFIKGLSDQGTSLGCFSRPLFASCRNQLFVLPAFGGPAKAENGRF